MLLRFVIRRKPRRAPVRRFPFGPAVALLLLLVGIGTLGLRLPDALLARLVSRSPAGSVSVPPAQHDAELERRLAEVLGPNQRGVAVAVQELRTGAASDLSGSESFVAASLFKLPILAEATTRIYAGTLDPDRRLEVRHEHWTEGAGVLQARVGERIQVRELLRLMVEESDNMAALVLLDLLGTSELNRAAAGWGLTGTRLVDRRSGDRGEHRTTAVDARTLLAGLASGRIGSPEASEEALRLLELKQSYGWLGADLPPFTRIAHKWGAIPPRAVHDAGLVYGPRTTFAIAVLSEGGSPTERERLIGRITRAAYDYFTR